MNLRDYIDYLTNSAYTCSGSVLMHDGVVFDDEQQASFDAVIEFPTGHKLCVAIQIERDDHGQAQPFLYAFHFQDKDGRLVERWDFDPLKDPEYHRHKPRVNRKIPDEPRELPDVVQMIWDYLAPEMARGDGQ